MAKTTIEKPLTSDERAFLAERGIKIFRAGDAQVVKETCGRCGGSGTYPSACYDGLCLRCSTGGTPVGYVLRDARKVITSTKRYETSARKAEVAAALFQVELDAQCVANEANGFGYVTNADVREIARERAHQAAQVAAENAFEAARFHGELGERVTLDAKVVRIRSFKTAYGFRTICVFHAVDASSAAEELVWFTSSAPDFDEGDIVRLTGTVKAHERNEYNGKSTKQTSLLRVKGEVTQAAEAA